jgi:hypothetical protein
MLCVTAIGEEQRDDRGEREERERSVDQAARIYFELGHCHMTRMFQHSYAGDLLKRKSHFGWINFGRAAVDNARPGQ